MVRGAWKHRPEAEFAMNEIPHDNQPAANAERGSLPSLYEVFRLHQQYKADEFEAFLAVIGGSAEMRTFYQALFDPGTLEEFTLCFGCLTADEQQSLTEQLRTGFSATLAADLATIELPPDVVRHLEQGELPAELDATAHSGRLRELFARWTQAKQSAFPNSL